MPLYFLMGTLSESGQRMLLRNSDLMVEAIAECRIDGANILGQYAVLGRCDYVMMVEADDNEAVGRLALEIGVKTGLHTETLPAMAIGGRLPRGPGEEEGLAEQLADPPGTEEWRLPTGSRDDPSDAQA